MIYGVTGSSQLLEPEESEFVRTVVKRTVLRSKRNKLVSGMAFGIDTEAILAVWGLMPFENIIATVPGTCNHNRALVEKLEKLGAVIVNVPNQHTVSATYLARDDETVRQVGPKGKLLAFPRTTVEVLRSGTWATVRRARKAEVGVRLYPLTNAIKEEV